MIVPVCGYRGIRAKLPVKWGKKMKGNGFGRFMITNYLYKIKFTPTKKKAWRNENTDLEKIK